MKKYLILFFLLGNINGWASDSLWPVDSNSFVDSLIVGAKKAQTYRACDTIDEIQWTEKRNLTIFHVRLAYETLELMDKNKKNLAFLRCQENISEFHLSIIFSGGNGLTSTGIKTIFLLNFDKLIHRIPLNVYEVLSMK